MNKTELIETVKTMIAAPSCCQDLKNVLRGSGWTPSVPRRRKPRRRPCWRS